MSESHEIPHPKKAAFLAAFAETGNVTRACVDSEIDRTTHYDWLKNDPGYAHAFEQAREEACDHLETEARRRAVDGVDEPHFYEGGVCGHVRKYSDTLLIFLLRGARPDKYRENYRHEHQGVAGAPPISIVEVVRPEGV